MKLSIDVHERDLVLEDLKTANIAFQQIYPGDKPDRQPVHTVYGGANLFKSDTCVKMGDIALKSLKTYSPNFVTLAKVLRIERHEDLPSSAKKIEKLVNKMEKMTDKERKKEAAWLPYSIYNKII